jgi:hypothetical protein
MNKKDDMKFHEPATEINTVIDAHIERWEEKASILMKADTDLLEAAKMKIKAGAAEELKLAIREVFVRHGFARSAPNADIAAK